jgi:hypothetical protein
MRSHSPGRIIALMEEHSHHPLTISMLVCSCPTIYIIALMEDFPKHPRT